MNNTNYEVMQTQLAVLDDAYLFYTGNPEERAVESPGPIGACYYITSPDEETGLVKRCAVGRCMIMPKHSMEGSAEEMQEKMLDIGHEIGLDYLLEPRYRGLGVRFWAALQHWHDDNVLWYGRQGDFNNPVDYGSVYEAYAILRANVAAGTVS